MTGETKDQGVPGPPSSEHLLAAAERVLDARRPRVAARLLSAIAGLCGDERFDVARARSCLALHDPQEALAALQPHVRNASAQMLLLRADALMQLGDRHAACIEAGRAMHLDPSPAAIGLHATLLMETGRTGQAADVLGAAIDAGVDDPGLHTALAVALLGLGARAAAQAAIARGRAAHPHDAGLRHLSLRAAEPATAA